MYSATIAGAIVCPGYDDGPAIKIGKDQSYCSFRFSVKQYNSANPKEPLYLHQTAKAFGPMVQLILAMGIQQGSYLNLTGSVKVEMSKDADGKQREHHVLHILEIEYANANGKSSSAQKDEMQNEAINPKKDNMQRKTGIARPQINDETMKPIEFHALPGFKGFTTINTGGS